MKNKLYYLGLCLAVAIASSCTTNLSKINSLSSSGHDVITVEQRHKAQETREYQDFMQKMKNKMSLNEKPDIKINTNLSNELDKNNFSVKSNTNIPVIRKSGALEKHPTQRSHERIDDKNLFYPVKRV